MTVVSKKTLGHVARKLSVLIDFRLLIVFTRRNGRHGEQAVIFNVVTAVHVRSHLPLLVLQVTLNLVRRT